MKYASFAEKNGARFYAWLDKGKLRCEWKVSPPDSFPFIDCTDMTDDEFEKFVIENQTQTP